MSLVAVVQRAGDRPGELPETRVIPVGMPQDTPFAAYFHPSAAVMATMAPPAPAAAPRFMIQSAFSSFAEEAQDLPSVAEGFWSPPAQQPTPEDELMNIAAQLEPDGGMPGDKSSERTARTAAAILAFVAAGHTATSGAFRSHVARLIAFLRAANLSSAERTIADRILDAATRGTAPAGDWIRATASADWAALAAALRP
jgi:hypothetical protein